MIRNLRTLFALMNRTLQTEDRLVRSHILRFVFLLLSYFMLVSIQSQSFRLSAPGLQLFTSVCTLNFSCITVAAISFFASAITEEKEDMTLGLLKMADVNPLALLIGKSAPRLITALVLLTAQFPFTMLAVTLGGVSLSQVYAAYFCLFAYLILCAYMALFYSVVFQRTRSAGFMTGLTLFVYFFGPVFFIGAKSSLAYYGWWPTGSWFDTQISAFFGWIGSTSAFTRIFAILQNLAFNESAISTQVITNVVAGGVFLFLSWLVFERCTQNEKPASEARGLIYKRLGTGNKLFGAGRAWGNALMWKDFNFVAGGKTTLVLKALLYSAILGLMVWSTRTWNRNFTWEQFGNIAVPIGLFALVVEAGIQASRVFYTETQWKTLSSIVLLPKSIASIAYSKVLGSAMALLPALSLIILGYYCAPQMWLDFCEYGLAEVGFWYSASQVIFAIHLTAFLSLYLRWGALPIAVALTFGGNIMISFFMVGIILSGPNSIDGFFALGTLVTMGLCLVIHFVIGNRLEAMAAG